MEPLPDLGGGGLFLETLLEDTASFVDTGGGVGGKIGREGAGQGGAVGIVEKVPAGGNTEIQKAGEVSAAVNAQSGSAGEGGADFASEFFGGKYFHLRSKMLAQMRLHLPYKAIKFQLFQSPNLIIPDFQHKRSIQNTRSV